MPSGFTRVLSQAHNLVKNLNKLINFKKLLISQQLYPFVIHYYSHQTYFRSLAIQNNKKSLSIMLKLFLVAKRRSTLTGGSPQLPSTLKSLTSVFGMGTGVTSLPSSLHLHMDVLESALQHGCCDLSRSHLLKDYSFKTG